MIVRLAYYIILLFAVNQTLRARQIIPILDSSFEKTVAWSSCNFADHSPGAIDHFDRLAITKSENPSFYALSLFTKSGKIKATGHQTNTILDEYCKSFTDLSFTFYIKSDDFKAYKNSLEEYLEKWCPKLSKHSRIKRISSLQYDSPEWNHKDIDVVLMIE
jgi:hypothetical protein